MKRFSIQTNDYMTPVLVELTTEQVEGLKKVFSRIVESEEEQADLFGIDDEDGNEIFSNYETWIQYNK